MTDTPNIVDRPAKRKAVWCVRHREGWCATNTGKEAIENRSTVKTSCGQYVMLPWGSEKRVPNCPDCRRKT